MIIPDTDGSLSMLLSSPNRVRYVIQILLSLESDDDILFNICSLILYQAVCVSITARSTYDFLFPPSISTLSSLFYCHYSLIPFFPSRKSNDRGESKEKDIDFLLYISRQMYVQLLTFKRDLSLFDFHFPRSPILSFPLQDRQLFALRFYPIRHRVGISYSLRVDLLKKLWYG